jgi:hypothetical protein
MVRPEVWLAVLAALLLAVIAAPAPAAADAALPVPTDTSLSRCWRSTPGLIATTSTRRCESVGRRRGVCPKKAAPKSTNGRLRLELFVHALVFGGVLCFEFLSG